MAEQPLQGAQLDHFRESVRQKSGHAARTDNKLVGVQIPALYIAGVVEGRGAITPETINSVLQQHRSQLETLFSETDLEGGSARQKIAAIEEVLQNAYGESSRKPTANAKQSEASQISMRYTDRKRENPPLESGQHEYFVHEAITKQARFNFKAYGQDIAYLAGVLDSKSGVNARTIEEAVYSRPLFHQEPRYNELTDALVAAAEAARNTAPKVEVVAKAEKPSATVQPQRPDLKPALQRHAESVLEKTLKEHGWGTPNASGVKDVVNTIVSRMEEVSIRELNKRYLEVNNSGLTSRGRDNAIRALRVLEDAIELTQRERSGSAKTSHSR